MLSPNLPRGDGTSTRIARIVQQLRSVCDLHARELEQFAGQLDAAGQTELAERLRVFRGLHADEMGVAIRELEDMLDEPKQAESRTPEQSPKRARWEEEQAQPQPLTRRELLNLGGESEPD